MSSPKVTYAYANGSANTIRPTSVTYPDGRVLTYNYGTAGGMNDRLSRVESLGFDGTGNLVQPAYLGLGTQVRTTMSEPQVRWDLATGSSPNPYAGLDRFGRVIDNKWTNYNTSATLDQIKYTYDRASNRTSRENVVAKAQTTPKYFDEYYQYDGSNRLTEMQRGQLSGSPPSGVTNKQFAQDWGLDPTGNWKVFKEDDNGDGIWDLNQTRTSNPVNEITAINETAGPSWVTPGYDSAGNMTTIPRPAEPTGDFTGIYDAWNRLVELRGLDDTVVGRYEYDGLTRRVVKHTYPGWEELEAADWDAMTEEDWNGLQLTQAHRRDYYYNSSWQILEERVENDTSFDRQYVWGLRYIDGLVFRDRQLASSVERNYALQDANWNVTALTDDNGAVVERYSYSAYGVPSFLNPDFTTAANNEAYDWDVLYAGYKWDAESALYQVRYRYLQPALGNWVTRDPMGFKKRSSSLYAYYFPIVSTDRYGLENTDFSVLANGKKEVIEWLDKQLGKNVPKNKAILQLTIIKGCIGLTSLNIGAISIFVRGKKGALPNMSACYKTLPEAQKKQKEMNDPENKNSCTPCDEKQFALSGRKSSLARVFMVQYSSKNLKQGDFFPESTTPSPKPNSEGVYNLDTPDNREAINTEASEGAIPFDYAFHSEEGDPWYNKMEHKDQVWLHANEGGDNMKIYLSNLKDMESQIGARSGFDEQYFCVACTLCID